MIKSRPTLADVAEKAGVSPSAVSRTFTPGASVSKETRKRVLAAADALGYRPNAIARTLTTRKSRIVAMVVSYLENQFYPGVIEMLGRKLQAQGYHLLLFIADDHGRPGHDQDTDPLLLDILQYQVDGIVLASTSLSSRLAGRCLAAGIPVVLFNRTSSSKDVSTVASDNVAGGRLATRFLIDCGAQRIAFIAGYEDSSTSRERETGMLAELAAAGMTLFKRAVGHYQFAAAAQATRALFSDETARPDALFIANDHMAIAAMDVLRNEFRLRIPDDVQVIGFDNVPQAEWGGYQLTTVEQDAEAMTQATISTLIEQINSPPPARPRHVVTPIRLIRRATTRHAGPGCTDP